MSNTTQWMTSVRTLLSSLLISNLVRTRFSPRAIEQIQTLSDTAPPDFQTTVSEWMGATFLPSLYSDPTERGDRFLEEALEMLQAAGYDRRRVATLVDYVWGRPAGELWQEVGGVMVTLAGFCWVHDIRMQDEGERELARIQTPEISAKIRAKQEAKNSLHFDTALPGGHFTDADYLHEKLDQVLDLVLGTDRRPIDGETYTIDMALEDVRTKVANGLGITGA